VEWVLGRQGQRSDPRGICSEHRRHVPFPATAERCHRTTNNQPSPEHKEHSLEIVPTAFIGPISHRSFGLLTCGRPCGE